MSTSNHFMYYHATGKNADTPTKPVKMTFPEWRQAAKVVEQNVSGPAPLYYLTMSGYSDQDVRVFDCVLLSMTVTLVVMCGVCSGLARI